MNGNKTLNLAVKNDLQSLTGEWDLVPSRQLLKLYNEDKEMTKAQIGLIMSRMLNIRTNISLIYLKEGLAARKQKLRNCFIKSNKVIKENKASMHRFYEKIHEYTQVKSSLNGQIDSVRADIIRYSKIKWDMESHVSQYSEKYEKFLEQVAENGPEFSNVQEILNRHETLEHCRKDCNRILKKELDEASAMREEMLKVVEVKSSDLKKLNNSLVMLQLRRKLAKEQRQEWEHVVQCARTKVSDVSEQNEALRNGCYDLYLQVSERRREPPTVPQENFKEQLHFIQNSIIFYKEVYRIAAFTNKPEVVQTRKTSDESNDVVFQPLK